MLNRVKRWGLICLAVAVAVACSSSDPQAPQQPAAENLAGMTAELSLAAQPTPAPTVSPKAAPDGAKLVAQRCVICHTRERIDKAQFDRAKWEATVKRMIGHGAKLTPEEEGAVVDYLASRGK